MKKVNFYSDQEVDLISNLKEQGLSGGEAFPKFDKVFPGRSKSAFLVKYYKKEAKSITIEKTITTKRKIIPNGYSTKEIAYLNELIQFMKRSKEGSTIIDVARTFVKKFPKRSVSGVEFKLRKMLKDKVTPRVVSFYSKEETQLIEKLISQNKACNNSYEEFNKVYPGRKLANFRQKFYLVKQGYKPVNITDSQEKIKVVEEVSELPFNNETNAEKEVTRKVIAQYFNESPKNNPRILTLPADNFIFESKLLTNKPEVELVCVEKNRNTYDKGIQTAMQMGVNYYRTECANLLKSTSREYDNMWLDFCGPYSSSVDDIIRDISVKNLLVKDGYLAITLLGARETYGLFKKYDEETRNTEIPAHICKLVPGLNLVNIYAYKSNGNSPMRVYVFKKGNVLTEPTLITLNEKKIKY